MNDDPATPDRATGGTNRRHRTSARNEWPTSLTRIAPNEIEIRGYPVDELMGRLMFSEGIYLLLRGELPTPSIGKLFTAVLLSSLDHGVNRPLRWRPATSPRRDRRSAAPSPPASWPSATTTAATSRTS